LPVQFEKGYVAIMREKDAFEFELAVVAVDQLEVAVVVEDVEVGNGVADAP
jgi:hypothetical protein